MILLAVFAAAAPADRRHEAAIQSLAEAERAFARTSVEKGMAAAFTEYFAPEGMDFQPEPGKFHERIRKPPSAGPRSPVVLNWAPVVADVSVAGDLGFTTGPFLRIDTSKGREIVGQGYYFSVWKKHAGVWRVLLDLGTLVPPFADKEQALSRPFHPARATPGKRQREFDAAAGSEEIARREKEFEKEAQGGAARAYRRFSSWNAETRTHRNGREPIVGRGALAVFLAGSPAVVRWKTMGSGAAASGDLGYTFGGYEWGGEKGYYIRVWKRISRGWVVVAESLRAAPPGP